MAPKKGRRGSKRVVGDASDPRGMAAMRDRYLKWLEVRNYARDTLIVRRQYINRFIEWSEERGINRPGEVSKAIIERYQRWLYEYRKKNGKSLSTANQHSQLGEIRRWYKWLVRHKWIETNPAADMELPRTERRLPREILTADEAEAVINQAKIEEALGLRDRAILETFYSTGIRRKEMISLKMKDVDLERGTLMIRQGKGNKDRLIPIGDRAGVWIEKYVREVRPRLLSGGDEGVLFLTEEGEWITADHMSGLVSAYVKNANIGKSGSCHLFRHAMATLMLENGADIRYVQEMLGHAELSTTQIYTKVSIRKLKEIHTATHPARMHRAGAQVEGPGRARIDGTSEARIEDTAKPGLPAAPQPAISDDSTADDLFTTLAVEAAEED